MIIKIFTVDKDNNIKLTKEELQSLLNEAYAEGRAASASHNNITWAYPPYTITNTNGYTAIKTVDTSVGLNEGN